MSRPTLLAVAIGGWWTHYVAPLDAVGTVGQKRSGELDEVHYTRHGSTRS